MSRRTPPGPKPATVECNNCGKVVARERAFFTLTFECCSSGCTQVMREKYMASERAEEEARVARRPKVGAFTFQNGGGSAY